jgi:hypothetical protein
VRKQESAAAEAKLLLDVAAKIKELNLPNGPGPQISITLHCACGRSILPPIALMPALWDRQRGLIKKRITGHLRDAHGVSRAAIGQFLAEVIPDVPRGGGE